MKRAIILLLLMLNIALSGFAQTDKEVQHARQKRYSMIHTEDCLPISYELSEELKKEIKQSISIVYADSSKTLIREYRFMGIPIGEPVVPVVDRLQDRGFGLQEVTPQMTTLSGSFGAIPNTFVILHPTRIRIQTTAGVSIVFTNMDDSDEIHAFYEALRQFLISILNMPSGEETEGEPYVAWRIGDLAIIAQQTVDYTFLRYMLMQGDEFLTKANQSPRMDIDKHTQRLVELSKNTTYYVADSLLCAAKLYIDFYEYGWDKDTMIVDSLVSVYTQLGDLYLNSTNTGTSIDYYERALAYYSHLYGKDNEHYALMLYDIGRYYGLYGDFPQELKCYKEVVNLGKEIYSDSLTYLLPLRALAISYINNMLYKEGEETCEKLQYYISLLHGNQTNNDYYTALLDQAVLFQAMGDYEKSLELLHKALEIIPDSTNEGNIYIALCYNNLGNIAYKQKDYNSALKWLNMANKSHEKIQSEDQAKYLAISYQQIGECYAHMKQKEDSAIMYFYKALRLYKKEYSKVHFKCADLYNDLSVCLRAKGDYEGALAYAREAQQTYSYFVEEDDPSLSTTYYNIASGHAGLNQNEEAEEYFRKAVSGIKKSYLQSLGFMSEKQRELYWAALNILSEHDIMNFEYHAYQKQPSIACLVYDNELFTKGLLLTSSDAVRRSVSESGDTILLLQWNEMTRLREVVASIQAKSPNSSALAKYQHQADSIEKEITRSSAAYRENMRQWNITWDSVRAELKPNQVAIEYMSAPLNDDSTMYCALLLRDTCSYPIMIPLFEEKQMTQDRTEQAALFWSNVTPYLNAGDEVYFSPTGIIHQIAIENLPYDSTRTMADVYHMVRLSSTRELAMHKQPIRHTSAALYGDIAYQEMDANTMLALSTKYNDGTRAANPSRLVDLSQEFEPTAPLPGTKAEIDSIAPILKKQHIAVKVYAQQEACEESVKALSGQKRNILHISTHGFFRPDNGKNSDPMDRCGLYFAGVDKVLKDGNSALPGNVDDGILTAKEISLLDLRDADLVVLSACETGLGDISGEGVFGLQRAFKMAGARTILMTLWRVHDDATRMLMTAFYRHYGQTHNKRTAFRAAQQEVRSTYQDPYYWAGFIMLD